MTNEDDVILRTEGISMVFPGTKALDDVDYKVYRGKVNVLVGENGAGKSTLMKVLAGVQKQSQGKIFLASGEEVSFNSTRDAEDKGIGIIFQELNLFPNLSVAENMFMAQEITKPGMKIDHAEQIARAAKMMTRLEQTIDPKAEVADLRIGLQQIVEIAKALTKDVNVLIMDEPTSALSSAEVEILFRIIEELKARDVSIIYISHRLEELVRIGDYISILRDGKMAAEAAVKDIDVPWIIDKMVGGVKKTVELNDLVDYGDEVIKIEGLTLPRQGGGYTVDHVDLSVRAGEIVGVYGLMGAGRSEMFDCLMGLYPESTGNVWLDGEAISGDVGDRIRHGLALIPEDRQREGLVQILSVAENMTMSSLWKFLKAKFVINEGAEKEAIQTKIGEMSIKVASPDNEVSSLSGGNQQKVVIGKALLTSPKVLLMDEPTRGIDVGAKAEVFQIMTDLAAKGLAIIFVSSDLDEIKSMSDRIIVMSNGQVTGRFERNDAAEEALVAASAIGHRASEQSNRV
ncbi:sugar ABC transporter ATP-binding protein [Cohaesibacter celericrescens]|uniref:sugar ABC transporter ATP-binding protein n=1 Tax=Cohaesibacter celericrescens TaxID=2067669 RepID=UPI0035637497